jgi:hypothetical protein
VAVAVARLGVVPPLFFLKNKKIFKQTACAEPSRLNAVSPALRTFAAKFFCGIFPSTSFLFDERPD